MNILYSLLVSPLVYQENDRFAKMTTPVFHTKKTTAIHDILIAPLRDQQLQNKAPLFASVICYMVQFTDFGKEIKQLDPVNTYVPVERSQNDLDGTMCISSLTTDHRIATDLRRYLDLDIVEKLQAPMWLDYMAAGCLQMLREVAK